MISSNRLLIPAVIVASLLLLANASLRGNDAIINQPHGEVHHRVLQESQVGIFLIKDIEYEDHAVGRKLQGDRPNQTNNIELSDGTIYEVKNAQAGWANNLKSGRDTIRIPPGAVISSDGTIDVKGNKPTVNPGIGNGLFHRNLEDGAEKRTPEQQRNLAAMQSSSSRVLQSGTRTVIVVRVLLTDGQYNWADQTGLSNDVFGNGADTYNLKSHYAACSYNQLTFNKSPDKIMNSDPGDGTTAITNGVVDVKVALAVSAGDGSVVNAVTIKINSVFGVSSPNQLANHVMYCLPSGTMTGIAYAYINSWNSVYSNQWCNYLSAQMHEIGHNLGYAHSNEGGTSYADQVGMMGYSYSVDEGPIMCFNAAKSWQTQWYASKSITVDPSAGGCFQGNLYGIADYGNAAASVVLIKIDDSTSTDFFVAFNRQTGINSGTQEAGNQVTVVRAGGEGLSYAESNLLAKLSVGGSWSGIAYGKIMNVNVLSISTGTSPGYAKVLVCVATSAPTRSPTAIPSASPVTSAPTISPTASPSASPVTSTPTENPTTSSPTTESPTRSPTAIPSASPVTSAPTISPVTSTPTENTTISSPTSGPPTLSPTTESPITVAHPTELPSLSPSNQPTPSPTMTPTWQPTSAPTSKPTNLSTFSPTRPPTQMPTRNPTRIPTRKPARKPK